jgi:adenylate cyclase class IV
MVSRNIEIKAFLRDRAAALATAARLSGSAPEIIHQQDIFFRCDGARLKLRIFAPDRGELIRYERANVAQARSSRYSIARTADPEVLLDILTQTLGVTGTVEKIRTLYWSAQRVSTSIRCRGWEIFSNWRWCWGQGKAHRKARRKARASRPSCSANSGLAPKT